MSIQRAHSRHKQTHTLAYLHSHRDHIGPFCLRSRSNKIIILDFCSNWCLVESSCNQFFGAISCSLGGFAYRWAPANNGLISFNFENFHLEIGELGFNSKISTFKRSVQQFLQREFVGFFILKIGHFGLFSELVMLSAGKADGTFYTLEQTLSNVSNLKIYLQWEKI